MILRPGAFAADVPFAGVKRLVALLPQRLGQRDLGGSQRTIVLGGRCVSLRRVPRQASPARSPIQVVMPWLVGYLPVIMLARDGLQT